MPEDLLLELETAPPVAGSLETIADLVRVVRREVGRAMDSMEGSARTFENTWQRLVRDVAKGHTAQIQALRPRLHGALEKRLALLKQTHSFATWLRKPGAVDVTDPDTLLTEIAGLEQLQRRVFDRWQTADDLEDLAARDYPLTTADLDQIGQNRRPPASYYAEESKPF
jgi:hypothetical protein